jgi:hypothetical protein
VRVADRQADVRIIWESGAITEFVLRLNKTGGHFHTTDEDTIALMRRLAERYDDTTIAIILAQQHPTTGTGLPFTRSRVNSLRQAHDIPVLQPDSVTPCDDDGDVATIYQAERLLDVDHRTIYRWLRTGFITGEQLTPGGPWHLRITDQFPPRDRARQPRRWLPLDQAARALGVARQTVLHKVQRGELAAVHINRGKRKGLRIQVEPASRGPSATTE